jgi:hypothetical protein
MLMTLVFSQLRSSGTRQAASKLPSLDGIAVEKSSPEIDRVKVTAPPVRSNTSTRPSLPATRHHAQHRASPA